MQNNLVFIIFISVVITIYSLLNYYFLKKNKNLLTTKSLPSILWKLLIFTLIVSPVATVIFSRINSPIYATITGFPGYSWLAFLFIFLIIHGVIDITMLIAQKMGYLPPKYMAKEIFIATMIISISVLTYGFFEARDFKVERIAIKTTKLPEKIKKIKIVQISDVHFSPLISTEAAKRIFKIVQKEKPDIIFSTGDMLDKSIRNSKEISDIIKQLKAPMGKYAITGNHEFLADINYSTEFITRSDFKLLRNEAVTIDDTLNIVGVDDKTGKQFGVISKISETELLQQTEQDKYTILLKHQPSVINTNVDYFDLQLSGHTHAGQLFPFTLLVKIAFPYLAGMYDIDDKTKIYVSRGTGTWGPPFRFLAPPEITVLELINDNY